MQHCKVKIENTTLKEKIKKLEKWKAEQLKVESEWNPQVLIEGNDIIAMVGACLSLKNIK